MINLWISSKFVPIADFSSILRLCSLSHCSPADSWTKSLQLGPLFCLKFLGERITVAAFLPMVMMISETAD